MRFSFPNGAVGYSDCHPWPELGDPALSEQLAFLAQKKTSVLLKKSFYFAMLDADARLKQKNLFSGLKVPKSHFLLMEFSHEALESAMDEGFDYVKMKVGKNFARELSEIKCLLEGLKRHGGKARLDFNERLSQNEFIQYLDGLDLSGIDFCEDPFRFDALGWKEIQQKYSIALACDRDSEDAVKHPSSSPIVVFKPALQEEKAFQSLGKTQKLIVTTYLDHPLGQATAAYTAAITTKEVCGLASHRVYEKNAFSEQLAWGGPDFKAPAGTGFGFDSLLEELSWKKLVS